MSDVHDKPPARVFKIFTAAQWRDFQNTERFEGSPDDHRDGFIHLSLAHQVAGTLERHFSGQKGLVIAAFETGRMGADLRMDLSRDGARFPHLYRALAFEECLGPVERDGFG